MAFLSYPVCLSAPLMCVPTPNPVYWSYAHPPWLAPPLSFTKQPTIVEDTDVEVHMVWASNLHQEFERIKSAVNRGCYTHAALDTEFKLGDNLTSRTHPRYQSPEERYRDLKRRVDGGKIKQVGLTLFSNEDMVVDQVWQFNFKPYNFGQEMELQSHNFITMELFSDCMVNSGLLWNPNISWVFFHAAYDVAYFLRLAMYWEPLPLTLQEFNSYVHDLLGDGQLYDIKYLTSFTEDLSGGLADVSESLGVKRAVGGAHEAGSDSLLTCHTFRRLIDCYFHTGCAAQHSGIKYGIDVVF